MAMFLFAKFRVQKTTTIKCVRTYLKAPKGLNKYLTTGPKNGKKGMWVLLLKINHTFKTKFPQICILIKIKNKLWHIQKC